MGLALVEEVSGSSAEGVSDCNIAMIGESLPTCLPGVQAAKKQPEQRLVFDYKAISALTILRQVFPTAAELARLRLPQRACGRVPLFPEPNMRRSPVGMCLIALDEH